METFPAISIYSGSVKVKLSNDSLKGEITLTSTGTGVSYKVIAKIYLLYRKGDRYYSHNGAVGMVPNITLSPKDNFNAGCFAIDLSPDFSQNDAILYLYGTFKDNFGTVYPLEHCFRCRAGKDEWKIPNFCDEVKAALINMKIIEAQ